MTPSSSSAVRSDSRLINPYQMPMRTQFPDSDPRKFDAARMQSIYYNDIPRYQVTGRDSSRKYAKRYEGLSGIDKGHISYYCGQVTGSIFNPITHAPALAVRSLFVDPNGVSKPTFDLDPRRLTREDMDRKRESNLSFLNDTSLHREDILAHNLRVYNQQRFDTSFC